MVAQSSTGIIAIGASLTLLICLVQSSFAQQCSSSQPGCCDDVTPACNSSYCSSDYGQAWCATTCKSCDVRMKCFNALGDPICEMLKYLCPVDPYIKYICRQSCNSCGSVTPSPVDNNNNCQDLTTTCSQDYCSNDAGQIFCARTCSTCDVRDRCFNAYGDSFCDANKDKCTQDVFWPQLCKKTCSNNCSAGNVTGSGSNGNNSTAGCQDLTTDCKSGSCSTDHQKVWCAKTCNACALRDACYNADGDEQCAAMARIGMCLTEPFIKVTCKKACTGCVPTSNDGTVPSDKSTAQPKDTTAQPKDTTVQPKDSTVSPRPTAPPNNPTTNQNNPTGAGCQDLTADCKNKPCTTDHQKVWCAQTCNACALRDSCYNADGDEQCAAMAGIGMCVSEPFIKVICKKACTGCVPTGNNNSTVAPNPSTVPPNYSSVPPNKSTVPPDESSVPPNDSTIPPNGSTIPPNGSTIPPNGSTIPPNESTVPPNSGTGKPNQNNSAGCEDLTDDCKFVSCNSDHEKVWCPKSCKSCALRDICYNADGDEECANMTALGMCTTEPYTRIICKKACTGCVPASTTGNVPSTKSTVRPNDSTVPPNESTVSPPDSTVLPNKSTVPPHESTVSPPDSTVLPNKSTLPPHESTVSPPDSTVLPNKSTLPPHESTVSPPDSTVLPTKSTVLPHESTVSPPDSTVLPNKSTASPPDSTVLPNKSTLPPHESTVSSPDSTVLPNKSTLPPHESTVSPPDSTVLPNKSTLPPHESTVSPPDSTVLPNKSTVSPRDSTVSPPDSTVLPNKSTVSPRDSTVSPPDSTVLPNKSTASPHDSTVSPNDSTVPPNKSTVPPNESTVSPHGSTVLTDASTVPPNKSTVLPNKSTVSPHDSTVSPNGSTVPPNNGTGNPNQNNSVVGCEDLSEDCKFVSCNSDHEKVWCPKSCKSCALRDICYNADGDEECANMTALGMCASEPYTRIICKKACTGCVPVSSSGSTPGYPATTRSENGKGTTPGNAETSGNENGKGTTPRNAETTRSENGKGTTPGAETGGNESDKGTTPSGNAKTSANENGKGTTPDYIETTEIGNEINTTVCQDLTNDCYKSPCQTDYQKVFCAVTCQTCHMRDICYNAEGDEICAGKVKLGMCRSEPFTRVTCKKACGAC